MLQLIILEKGGTGLAVICMYGGVMNRLDQDGENGVVESDESLIERTKNGDVDAYEELVHRYQHKIMHYISRMLGNRELAEDIAQETFLRVFSKAHTFKRGSVFSTWLYRIATNLSINQLRRKKIVSFLQLDKPYTTDKGDDIKIEFPDSNPGPDEDLLRREMRERIQATIDILPPKFKLVLVMRDIQGLSYEEIARILDKPEGTVKSRVNRARNKFKGLFSPYLEQ